MANQQAPQNNPPASTPNPKLTQFLEEVNELQEKYQYVLTPTLQYNQNGITPTIRVVDKIPKKGPVKKEEPKQDTGPEKEKPAKLELAPKKKGK